MRSPALFFGQITVKSTLCKICPFSDVTSKAKQENHYTYECFYSFILFPLSMYVSNDPVTNLKTYWATVKILCRFFFTPKMPAKGHNSLVEKSKIKYSKEKSFFEIIKLKTIKFVLHTIWFKQIKLHFHYIYMYYHQVLTFVTVFPWVSSLTFTPITSLLLP